jgi:hypothetical protein
MFPVAEDLGVVNQLADKTVFVTHLYSTCSVQAGYLWVSVPWVTGSELAVTNGVTAKDEALTDARDADGLSRKTCSP